MWHAEGGLGTNLSSWYLLFYSSLFWLMHYLSALLHFCISEFAPLFQPTLEELVAMLPPSTLQDDIIACKYNKLM